ncbi:hypothetical protein BG842_08815 [Haladaptatus sp. W1]|uniref:DUF5779 family protein n=1 Tax=unclassified Haladaptatus TaxID=2622732 RepID=UPI000849A76D|nr:MULTISPECIES: DUF5779 family protein [unclassified Haladaptatus]ODR81572.1 hypothetical protein BG842_08815 [Haladaptatus sp. W1]GKZ12250.1 hypothetical protein HAL_01310 [Haladaptatus sp. T7]
MNDSGFDLDLQAAEQEIEFDENERVILGVLDGTTAIAERLDAVERGHVLVLAVDGDLTELAADLAPAVKKQGGNLVHFRKFLIISPPGIEIDTSRL